MGTNYPISGDNMRYDIVRDSRYLVSYTSSAARHIRSLILRLNLNCTAYALACPGRWNVAICRMRPSLVAFQPEICRMVSRSSLYKIHCSPSNHNLLIMVMPPMPGRFPQLRYAVEPSGAHISSVAPLVSGVSGTNNMWNISGPLVLDSVGGIGHAPPESLTANWIVDYCRGRHQRDEQHSSRGLPRHTFYTNICVEPRQIIFH